MTKHTLHIHTNETHFFMKDGESFINVFWKIDFNRDLDLYFHKKKYVHDFDMFKDGVGRLEIRFKRSPAKLKPEHIAYIETLAAKHIVSNSGINAFGFSDDNHSIRRDQLKVLVSNPDSAKLIDRKGVEQSFFDKYSALAALSSPPAAYLYGVSTEYSDDISWLQPYIESDLNFENYNKAVDIQIISNDHHHTSLGNMIVDYRSVQEWMGTELIKFQQEEEGGLFPRPYQLVVEGLKSMTNIIYKDSKFLDNLREKFGADCLILTDKDYSTMIQVQPVDPENQLYKVLGVRHHIPVAKLERMQAKGYALDIELNATPEQLEASRQRYSEAQERTKKTRMHRKSLRG